MKLGTITVSRHAIDEAIRDFRVNPKVAEEWLRSNLKKAEFIANIVSEEGKPCRLFAFNRAAFILADTVDYVITVYPRHSAPTDLYSRVKSVVLRELAKFERKERVTARRVSVEKAKLTVERAKCAYRMAVTPSKSVIAFNTKRIDEIDAKLTQLDAELMRARKEKSAVAKSIVMFV